jgi:hypothetical protein
MYGGIMGQQNVGVQPSMGMYNQQQMTAMQYNQVNIYWVKGHEI